ncbi:hypothetical protein WG901_06110 [Novosphingobium sp. PS1R-30]|uniref:Secreted protein n=1 Tax=Novosphingobium anseongense TaxID=3133436 RepID=A0ABU8RSW5_9SPHN
MTTVMAVAAKAKFLVLFILSSPLSPPVGRFPQLSLVLGTMRRIGRFSAHLPNRFLAFRIGFLAFIREVSSNTWNFSPMFPTGGRRTGLTPNEKASCCLGTLPAEPVERSEKRLPGD